MHCIACIIETSLCIQIRCEDFLLILEIFSTVMCKSLTNICTFKNSIELQMCCFYVLHMSIFSKPNGLQQLQKGNRQRNTWVQRPNQSRIEVRQSEARLMYIMNINDQYWNPFFLPPATTPTNINLLKQERRSIFFTENDSQGIH